MKVTNSLYNMKVFSFCIIFSISIIGLGELWIKVDKEHEEALLHDSLLLNGAFISQEIQKRIYSTVYAANTLKTLLLSSEFKTDKFEYWGNQIVTLNGAASTVQLAPDGIVTYSYPLKDNEKAVGHDLLKDPSRKNGARKAITSQELTFVGPVKLMQNNKYAVIARNPIFEESAEGDTFWGFAIALLLLDDVIDNVFQNQNKGLHYQLLGDNPDAESPPIFYSTENFIDDGSLILAINVPNGSWTLKMNHSPIYNNYYSWLRAILIFFTSFLSIVIYTQQVKIKIRSDKILNLNEQLTEMTMTDELTGAGNRRAGILNLDDCIKKANRYKYKACILLIDIDFFKNINDKHGHITGDQFLVHIVSLFKSTLRECDSVVRLGGDEFLIILSGIGKEEGRIVTQKLYDTAQAAPFSFKHITIPVSFSTGIAEYTLNDTVAEFIHKADEMLYKSKEMGRNRFSD